MLQEIVDAFMFEPADEITRAALEQALKAVCPGDYTVNSVEGGYSIIPSSREEAVWLALMW